MKRGLIAGIPGHDVTMKQIQNSEEEFTVLKRFPFHEAATKQSMLTLYSQAIRFTFDIVPEEKQIAVLGRFARKLVKRMRYFENQAQKV
jgi:hypothetical protein